MGGHARGRRFTSGGAALEPHDVTTKEVNQRGLTGAVKGCSKHDFIRVTP
jgi:hypothetical protein